MVANVGRTRSHARAAVMVVAVAPTTVSVRVVLRILLGIHWPVREKMAAEHLHRTNQLELAYFLKNIAGNDNNLI